MKTLAQHAEELRARPRVRYAFASRGVIVARAEGEHATIIETKEELDGFVRRLSK